MTITEGTSYVCVCYKSILELRLFFWLEYFGLSFQRKETNTLRGSHNLLISSFCLSVSLPVCLSICSYVRDLLGPVETQNCWANVLKSELQNLSLNFFFNICGSVHHALYWWNTSNKMQQLRFLFAMALLYMFRVTISPIIRSTMLYMATGELARLGCY